MSNGTSRNVGGDETTETGVFSSLVGDGSWTMAAKIYSQIIQLTLFVVAARILEPAEFGIFAFVSAIAVILITLSEGGWREYILKSTDFSERLDEVATISFISACFFTACSLGVAYFVYQTDGDSWGPILIGLFSLWILPATLSAIYQGLLVANGSVRSQARIAMISETIGFVAALVGFVFGWSIIALVAGRLAMQFAYLAFSILVTKWAPKPRFEWSFTKELLEYSRHIVVLRLTLQVRNYGGTLAIGYFLGMAEAGIFRAAQRVVAALVELVQQPVSFLAWIVFRKIQKHSTETTTPDRMFEETGRRFITMFYLLILPAFIGLALVSSSVVEVLLGEKWLSASLIVSLLCIRQILLLPVSITEPLLSLRGKVSKIPPIALLNVAVEVGGLLLLAPFGLLSATVSRVIAGFFGFVSTIYLQSHYGGISWFNILRQLPIVVVPLVVLAIVTLWAGSTLHAKGFDTVVQLASQTVLGAISYFGTLGLLRLAGFGRNTIFVGSGDLRAQTEKR